MIKIREEIDGIESINTIEEFWKITSWFFEKIKLSKFLFGCTRKKSEKSKIKKKIEKGSTTRVLQKLKDFKEITFTTLCQNIR